MGRRINPNLKYLHQELKFKRRSELRDLYDHGKISYDEYKATCEAEGILSGVVLEGSSRSLKTISSIDFITYVASTHETSAVFNIIKETYVSFKTTLYNDFNWRLPFYGLRSPFQNRQEVRSFYLWGNKINLIGADSESAQLGVGCDYLYINEALDVPKAVRDQAVMRCRKFWWYDFNPKYTEHDIFTATIGRKDVGHLKTTYKDNWMIAPQERTQIEGYQPVELSKIAIHLGSQSDDEAKKHTAIQKALKYDTDSNPDKYPKEDINELVRCRYNEQTGTADKYQWMVYGLGERMAPEGLIFPKITWINKFPDNIENVYYGCDFGYTVDPSVLVKVGVQGTNMFIQYLFYQPTPTPTSYIELLRKHITENDTVWCDPSGDTGGRGYISEARRAGYRVFGANTFPGSIKYGISIMKKYNIHVVDVPEARKEFTGYTRAKAKVNGVMVLTDDPIDANNHGIDATRMPCISNRL